MKLGKEEWSMLIPFLEKINWYIILWLIVIIVFLCIELSTVTLTSIWFAAGGLIALFVAMAKGDFLIQVIAFLVAAFGLFFLTKPWAERFVNRKKIRTNADRAIGEEVRILERVSNLDQTGMAVVHGQEWTVRTEDDKEIIEAGERVRIVRISGVKLIVERIKN